MLSWAGRDEPCAGRAHRAVRYRVHTGTRLQMVPGSSSTHEVLGKKGERLKSLRMEGDDLLQTLVSEITTSLKQLQGNGNGQKACMSVQLWQHPALENWDASLFQGAFTRQAPIHSNIDASYIVTSGRCWKVSSLAKSCCCLLPTFHCLCLFLCPFTFLAVPTSPLCLFTAPQHTCTCLPVTLPTAAFPHIPVCPLPLAEQKPRWLTARREYEKDNDLF